MGIGAAFLEGVIFSGGPAAAWAATSGQLVYLPGHRPRPPNGPELHKEGNIEPPQLQWAVTDIDRVYEGRGNWPRGETWCSLGSGITPWLLVQGVVFEADCNPHQQSDHQLARHRRPLHRHDHIRPGARASRTA